MLETDEKWTNEYLTETLSRKSEIKIQSDPYFEKNSGTQFGIDLGSTYIENIRDEILSEIEPVSNFTASITTPEEDLFSMASTEKAKNKVKKSTGKTNLGKPGPKSKRTKPVGSKKRKKGAHWKGSSEVPVGTDPILPKKMESDDSDVEIPDDLMDDPLPKTKSLKEYSRVPDKNPGNDLKLTLKINLKPENGSETEKSQTTRRSKRTATGKDDKISIEKPAVQPEKNIPTNEKNMPTNEKMLPINEKMLPINEINGSVQCGPPMADVKDPYSYHKQSKIPLQPIKLKSRKLVKDNFGRRSDSPKRILPGSRDHVAQILSPQTKSVVKKRPGPKTGAKIGPKTKRSKKTVPEPSSDPMVEQEFIQELDNKVHRPDFVCVTDTESEEEPETKPLQIVISPMRRHLLDPKLIHADQPSRQSNDRGPIRNPHLGAIWEVNGHGISNDELPTMELIEPTRILNSLQKTNPSPIKTTEKLFSDEDESILTENEKNGISDVLNSIDTSTSLQIVQDDVINDIINDSNDCMDISIHGNFSNLKNVDSQTSSPDVLSSLLETETILALTYNEHKEVQTSFPVKHFTEIATQAVCDFKSNETQTETKMGSISVQTDTELVPIMISKQTDMNETIMISTETMTDDNPTKIRETTEMGVQTCPDVTSSEMCAPVSTSDTNRGFFVHSTPRNIMKNHIYDGDSISCYSSADSGADSSISLIKDLEEKLKESERRNSELLLKYDELEKQFQKKENVHLIEKCGMQAEIIKLQRRFVPNDNN